MPRRKITEKAEGDLPEISVEEMVFVQELANGASASDAYRRGFPNSLKWQATSVWSEASRLKRSYKVRIWLNAISDHKLSAAALTRESHLNRLEELAMKAETSGNFGAAVQAEQLRGKVQGYYVEKHEDVTQPQSREQFINDLYRDWGENGIPVIKQIAGEMDMNWDPETGKLTQRNQNGTEGQAKQYAGKHAEKQNGAH